MKRRAAKNYLVVEKGVGTGAGVDVMRVGGGFVSCVAAGGASAVRPLASAGCQGSTPVKMCVDRREPRVPQKVCECEAGRGLL